MEHLRYLESQFLNEDFADINFIVGDGQTVKPAHKVVLAAGSLVLGKRLTKNDGLNKIEITNTSSAAFEEFLFTFYSSYPEKNFTLANAAEVLMLSTQFEVVHCIKAIERFLLKNLSVNQLCFGFTLAVEYSLLDLKSHCVKEINEKKRDVFASNTFLACSEHILCALLENLAVNQRDEIETIWDGCMDWARNQCNLRSIDASDMGNWREVFGKSTNEIYTILSKDGEILDRIMAQCKGVFDDIELNYSIPRHAPCLDVTIYEAPNDTLNKTFIMEMDESIYTTLCESNQSVTLDEAPTIVCIDENQNKELEFARFRETILSPQTCYAETPISIEIQSTKQIALNGIAFTTVSGRPKGKLTIGMRSGNGEVVALINKKISSRQSRKEPNNFVAVENVVLQPNKLYVVTVQLSKDVTYRASRHIESEYKANDFAVTVKASRRDIFSHFFFTEIF